MIDAVSYEIREGSFRRSITVLSSSVSPPSVAANIQAHRRDREDQPFEFAESRSRWAASGYSWCCRAVWRSTSSDMENSPNVPNRCCCPEPLPRPVGHQQWEPPLPQAPLHLVLFVPLSDTCWICYCQPASFSTPLWFHQPHDKRATQRASPPAAVDLLARDRARSISTNIGGASSSSGLNSSTTSNHQLALIFNEDENILDGIRPPRPGVGSHTR